MHMGASASLFLIYSSINVLVITLLLVNLISRPAMADSNNKNSNTGPPDDMSTATLIKVDPSGGGDFKKIQDAIDAVPSKNSDLVFIWVKPGVYREKIVVPADKPYVTLSGSAPSKTIITWNDTGEIYDSPTMAVLASDFVGRHLTIQNSYGKTGKGVALRVSGDRAAFYSCRILSYQDTLLDDAGKHYYQNCFIEGGVDFIFGNAASLYERCHLHSIAEYPGAITAQHRSSPLENTGYTFVGCKITGKGNTVLGRTWGSYSRVVYAQTYMSSVVLPEGWNDWGNPSNQRTAYYGEYKCYGPGASRIGRVKWSRTLSKDEVAPFLTETLIGGRRWLRPIPTHFISLASKIADSKGSTGN